MEPHPFRSDRHAHAPSLIGLTGSATAAGHYPTAARFRAQRRGAGWLDLLAAARISGHDHDQLGRPVRGWLAVQAVARITDGLFLVTTTADSGQGSLRQAILDSNAEPGGTNTIDFAIPARVFRPLHRSRRCLFSRPRLF